MSSPSPDAPKVRQIRRLEDLPAEFALEKYSSVCTFDIAEWAANLERRSYCRFLLGHGRIAASIEARHPEAASNIRSTAGLFTVDLLKNPLIACEEFENQVGGSKSIHASHIADFTVGDAYWIGHEASGERYPAYAAAIAVMLEKGCGPGTELTDDPVWKMYLSGGIDDESDVSITVDLHGSEDKIVKDFIVWLRAIRAERGIEAPKKNVTQQDFAKWTAYGVLPYLDLTMWAVAHGVEITHQVLGSALFPNEYNINLPEHIRKVVRPLATSLNREVFTDALRSQALAEIAESKSAKNLPSKFHHHQLPDQ